MVINYEALGQRKGKVVGSTFPVKAFITIRRKGFQSITIRALGRIVMEEDMD